MSRSHEFEDTDRRRITETDAEQRRQITGGRPSKPVLFVSGMIVVIFSVQLVGVVIGALPADGSGQDRLLFGVMMLVGVITSTLAFLSLYRRAHVEPTTGGDDT